MRHGPLVSCETVFESLGRDDWVLFDCRHDLMDAQAGPLAYADSHITGAYHAHIDHDLSSPVGDGGAGRHPLPDPEAFRKFLATHGVTEDIQIVAYDEGPGMWAARLWWLARDMGLHVAVLDGGLAQWQRLGLPIDSETPPLRTVELTAQAGRMPRRSAEEVAASDTVIDARAPERFRGDEEPIDPVAGHIPGAINRPYSDNLGADGLFRSPDELRAAYDGLDGAVVYCGSGVTAAHDILAMEVAGLSAALYPGSWSEWVAKGRPAATGP